MDRAGRNALLWRDRFYDDYLKIKRRSSNGFGGWGRLALEFAIAAAAAFAVMQLGPSGFADALTVPFFKNVIIPLGFFFVVMGALVIAGAGNAVNLTDGLDGLAIVPVMIATATFGLIAYLSGNANFAKYLQIHYVAGTGELAVICGALIGAGLGFLWFNAPPAMIFMGDTGSLALGGALGAIAVATKHEIVLAIVGGLFVLETLSVIIQVASYKMTGRRVFKMAPLHHHFEQKGWHESTVVVRFWIISVVLALVELRISQAALTRAPRRTRLISRMIRASTFAGRTVAVLGSAPRAWRPSTRCAPAAREGGRLGRQRGEPSGGRARRGVPPVDWRARTGAASPRSCSRPARR